MGKEGGLVQSAQLIEFAGNHWELVLIFIGILALLSYDLMLGDQGSLDPLEAVTVINRQDAAVVDVRSMEEFTKGHIVNAINIPMNSFVKQLGILEKYKERPIVVNCNSGGQSAQACNQLRKRGFKQVYNLRGGILAWENADLPVIRK